MVYTSDLLSGKSLRGPEEDTYVWTSLLLIKKIKVFSAIKKPLHKSVKSLSWSTAVKPGW